MEDSKIEWTHHTFNPWMGCTKVSPGCANCYAETLMDKRLKQVRWGKGQPRTLTGKDNWRKPRRWNRTAENAEGRPRVFCASLADWLDDEVPIGWIADLLELVRETPNLDWLLLTKRPEKWRDTIESIVDQYYDVNDDTHVPAIEWLTDWLEGNPPENIWMGTSAEDQTRWDERIPILTQIPAKIRFVSAEPLLGPIHMRSYLIDWLIVGGESGPGARPMKREWVESLLDQCDDRTAFHFKQWGGVDKKAAGRELLGRTWDELPNAAAR